ncbi:nuclear transport factor 2 family protein [Blastococcus sp. URHD0036]|uniref:nuclear transport factor 2 family protein n=1 Tax=Blastococcus sp. URHD0036 TaxID=1380356 RepID=UPI000496397B|nr:nuclear transport factor 2 family protein [Blastococcus sp. URHD0036]
MSGDLERALALADVVQLHAEYARLIDARDFPAWSLLFTEDATLVLAAGTVTGRDELVRFARESPVGVHLPALPSVEPQPDGGVLAVAPFAFVNAGARTVVAGTYRDQLVRGDSGLRFRRREIEARGRLELDVPGEADR